MRALRHSASPAKSGKAIFRIVEDSRRPTAEALSKMSPPLLRKSSPIGFQDSAHDSGSLCSSSSRLHMRRVAPTFRSAGSGRQGIGAAALGPFAITLGPSCLRHYGFCARSDISLNGRVATDYQASRFSERLNSQDVIGSGTYKDGQRASWSSARSGHLRSRLRRLGPCCRVDDCTVPI